MMENDENKIIVSQDLDNNLKILCKNAVDLVNYSKKIVLNEINTIQLMTYFTLGKWIVDVQQDGEERAKYGKQVLQILSEALNNEFGKGFSVSTLTNIRKFYLIYQDRISEPVVTEFVLKKSEPAVTKLKKELPFHLSWIHYLILMRIENKDERDFYEMQALKEGWGKRELRRQYNSSLYERLLLGKEKEKILKSAKKVRLLKSLMIL